MIDEFLKRKISFEDFMIGAPGLKVVFSKLTKKFNKELLKSTCQVIGCKPIYANKIAEGVFDELNNILNNLSEYIHFDLNLYSINQNKSFQEP